MALAGTPSNVSESTVLETASGHRFRWPKFFAVNSGGRGRREPLGDSLPRILYYTADAGFGDLVGERQIAEALAVFPITEQSNAIDLQWSPADLLAFEAGPPHSGAHPLYNKGAFQFGDGADDDHHGPAKGSTGIDVLSEADELYIFVVEFVEHFEEVPG